MIRRNESIGRKKWIAFISAFLVAISVSVFSVTAETNDAAKNRAGMINNLMNFIRNAEAPPSDELQAQEPDPSPEDEPAVTPGPEEGAPGEDDETPKDDNIYIKVYFHREGVVKSVALDDYIMGVIYGEVPETYNIEALKAQAVAARSYTMYRISNNISHENGADVCTDYTHCQAWTEADSEGYPEPIIQAVQETHNIVGTYDGKCINALYFSNSGGYTEAVENVWGGAPFPYLVSVESPGEAGNYDFCSVKYFTPDGFVDAICSYSEDMECSADDAVSNITQIQRSESGRIISAKISGKMFTGQQLRAMFGTLSSNIHFEKLQGGAVAVVSIGYGHGVGMSQCGAQAMAESGADYETILKHYYIGIELEKLS